MCFCALTRATIFVLVLVVFCVFSLCCCLLVSIGAFHHLERLVSKMTFYVSSGH